MVGYLQQVRISKGSISPVVPSLNMTLIGKQGYVMASKDMICGIGHDANRNDDPSV